MKKILLAMIFLSSSTFAYNTSYAKLTPGKKIFVDSQYNQSPSGNIVSLELDTKSKDGSAEPVVTISKQWSGFECEYKQTLLSFSGYNSKNKTHVRTWEIQIEWAPGADLSGCIVNVDFPGLNTASAEIFMNY